MPAGGQHEAEDVPVGHGRNGRRRGLDRACPGCHVSRVKVKTVSFEKMQRDKRRARLRDERRLASGEVTPEQLEEENSLVLMNAKITIPDFCQTLERYYGK